MTNRIASLLFVSFLAACGGGGGGGDDDGDDTSGVDQSQAITELDDAEVTAFCQWAIEVQGGAGTEIDCGDGVTITVYSRAECEAEYAEVPAGCSGVTVGELELCVDAIAEDACSAFGAEACAEYFECAL